MLTVHNLYGLSMVLVKKLVFDPGQGCSTKASQILKLVRGSLLYEGKANPQEIRASLLYDNKSNTEAIRGSLLYQGKSNPQVN